jgi:hypothetical protein
MQDFICNNCWIKIDGQFYDDTNIINYLYYCDDCYNQIKSNAKFQNL